MGGSFLSALGVKKAPLRRELGPQCSPLPRCRCWLVCWGNGGIRRLGTSIPPRGEASQSSANRRWVFHAMDRSNLWVKGTLREAWGWALSVLRNFVLQQRDFTVLLHLSAGYNVYYRGFYWSLLQQADVQPLEDDFKESSFCWCVGFFCCLKSDLGLVCSRRARMLQETSLSSWLVSRNRINNTRNFLYGSWESTLAQGIA